ncbi:cytochrome P450 [Trichoderma evansii]
MILTLLPFYKATYEQATLLGVVVCLFTALLSYLPSYLPTRPVKYFPGPKPWPLLGNFFYYSKVLKNVTVELPLMAKNFGDICMLWMGSKPNLLIHNLEDAHEILTKRSGMTSNRPRTNIFVKRIWPGVLPFAQVGEEMRFYRRIYMDILGPRQSQEVRKYQDYETKMGLVAFCEKPDEFVSHVTRFAMSVIFSAVYGTRISQLDHSVMVELYDVWNTGLRNIQPGHLIIDWLPILEKLPLWLQPWAKLADSLHERETAINRAFLKLLRKRIEAGIVPACFGIDALAYQKKQGFDDSVLVDLLGGIVVAGSETTATIMQSFMKLIAMHPEAQKKAQEELDRVVGPSRLPAWEDQPNLPYIRALIKELHRYSPILTFAVPHASTEEIVYRGNTIPNDTVIMPCQESLHHDPKRYDNAEAFQPERFLGDDLDSLVSARQRDYWKRDHVDYGFGRRMCPGIQVAENSLFIQISRYLWAFNITPKPGEPPLDMDDWQELFTRKPRPFKVNITPRSDAIVQVIQQTAKEAQTDIPDVDDIEMGDLNFTRQ